VSEEAYIERCTGDGEGADILHSIKNRNLQIIIIIIIIIITQLIREGINQPPPAALSSHRGSGDG
jgi:hypothetical protein